METPLNTEHCHGEKRSDVAIQLPFPRGTRLVKVGGSVTRLKEVKDLPYTPKM